MRRVQRGCGSARVSLDIWGCKPELLTDSGAVEKILREIIERYDLGLRKVFIDTLDGDNASYEMFISLQDSFIVVETWANDGVKCHHHYMKVVFDFCGHSKDRRLDVESAAADFVTKVVAADAMVEKLVSTLHGP